VLCALAKNSSVGTLATRGTEDRNVLTACSASRSACPRRARPVGRSVDYDRKRERYPRVEASRPRTCNKEKGRDLSVTGHYSRRSLITFGNFDPLHYRIAPGTSRIPRSIGFSLQLNLQEHAHFARGIEESSADS